MDLANVVECFDYKISLYNDKKDYESILEKSDA